MATALDVPDCLFCRRNPFRVGQETRVEGGLRLWLRGLVAFEQFLKTEGNAAEKTRIRRAFRQR